MTKKFLYRNFFVSLLFIFIISNAAHADKWKTMTFEDIAKGLEELGRYCLVHDITVEDVLWANNSSTEEIKSGQTIYLPENQIDMLAIWQNKGAWKPTALVPVTSAAAANRLKNKQTPQQNKTPEPKVNTASITPNLNTQMKKSKSTTDSVLNSEKSKAQTEEKIPGLMDPIIILSPNGDPSSGPMRLIISGDKVEVVQLPQNAVPKRPSLADLDHTFGTSPSYLPPYYSNNNINNRKNNNYQNYTLNLGALNGKMLWPVNGTVSSPFGQRGKRRHDGIDIPMPLNTPIRAARNGIVARTGTNTTPGFRGYGNFVLLDHGGGVKTLYAHCSSVGVVEGQRIMQGQIIAFVGSTGRSTTTHLHFEVRINDRAVNPMPYLSANPQLASRTR